MAFGAMLKVILAACAVAGVAGHAKLRLEGEKAKELSLRQQRAAAKEPQHRLRVCNAYPYMTELNVFIGKPSGLTKITDSPMPYKACREFDPQLEAGDRIDFRFQEASAGTFVVGDLPSTDAVLMLVIYRHSTKTTAVAFESHVFANLLNAQIAVLDTYKGPAKSTIKIQDAEEASTSRSEPLAPNSVVALNPGKYEVVLMGADGSAKSRSDLTVDNRESCVVIRCGVEPVNGRAYPQELMVYPIHPPARKASRSAAKGSVGFSLLSVLSLLVPLLIGA
jgi:hypothetical protein